MEELVLDTSEYLGYDSTTLCRVAETLEELRQEIEDGAMSAEEIVTQLEQINTKLYDIIDGSL